jgi:hypothetical protein
VTGGTLALGGLAVTLVGAGFAWLGWRGGREGDHEVCRRCGFDLFGRPRDSRACPECGSDLLRARAIVIGHRRRRPIFLAVGIVVCVVFAGASGWVISPWGRRVNWVRYEPASLLARDADIAPSAADRAAAMGELLKRLREGRLSAGAVSSVAERALRRQADRNKPWDTAWGDFVENARAVRLVTDQQWERYLAGALVGYQVEVPLVASRQTGLAVGVNVLAGRTGSNQVVDVRSSEQWEVSGIPLDPYEGIGYSVVYHVHRVGNYGAGGWAFTVPLNHRALHALRPGPQTFTLKLKVEVFESPEEAGKLHEGRTIATQVFPFTATWRLVPEEEAQPSPPPSPGGAVPTF